MRGRDPGGRLLTDAAGYVRRNAHLITVPLPRMPPTPLPARTTLLGLLDGLRGRVRFEYESDFPEGPFVFNDSVSRDAIYALANRGGQVPFRGLLALPDEAGEAREVEATMSLHKVGRHDGQLAVEVRLEGWRALPEDR